MFGDKIRFNRDTVKAVVGFAADYGVTLITYNVIKTFVPNPKIHQKVALGIVAYAIGGVTSERAADFLDNAIDEAFNMLEKVKAEVQERQR